MVKIGSLKLVRGFIHRNLNLPTALSITNPVSSINTIHVLKDTLFIWKLKKEFWEKKFSH